MTEKDTSNIEQEIKDLLKENRTWVLISVILGFSACTSTCQVSESNKAAACIEGAATLVEPGLTPEETRKQYRTLVRDCSKRFSNPLG